MIVIRASDRRVQAFITAARTWAQAQTNLGTLEELRMSLGPLRAFLTEERAAFDLIQLDADALRTLEQVPLTQESTLTILLAKHKLAVNLAVWYAAYRDRAGAEEKIFPEVSAIIATTVGKRGVAGTDADIRKFFAQEDPSVAELERKEEELDRATAVAWHQRVEQEIEKLRKQLVKDRKKVYTSLAAKDKTTLALTMFTSLAERVTELDTFLQKIEQACIANDAEAIKNTLNTFVRLALHSKHLFESTFV